MLVLPVCEAAPKVTVHASEEVNFAKYIEAKIEIEGDRLELKVRNLTKTPLVIAKFPVRRSFTVHRGEKKVAGGAEFVSSAMIDHDHIILRPESDKSVMKGRVVYSSDGLRKSVKRKERKVVDLTFGILVPELRKHQTVRLSFELTAADVKGKE